MSNNVLRCLAILMFFTLGGCVGPRSNIESPTYTGINVDYLFGSRRTTSQVINPVMSDSEYLDYRQWRLWQEFLAYQEWKQLNQ